MTRSHGDTPRRSRGFTLVEMIVAAVVLVLGVVSAMACIGSATRSTGTAADYTTAALLAQQQLSQIQANPSELTGGDQQGDFSDDHPGFSWHQTVEATDLASLEKVTLVIEWRSGLVRRSA